MPIWIKQYTLCVGCGGDHRSMAWELVGVPALLPRRSELRHAWSRMTIWLPWMLGGRRNVPASMRRQWKRRGCPGEDALDGAILDGAIPDGAIPDTNLTRNWLSRWPTTSCRLATE